MAYHKALRSPSISLTVLTAHVADDTSYENMPRRLIPSLTYLLFKTYKEMLQVLQDS